MSPLRVAIVVASLRFLGGQSIQAHRMLEGFRTQNEIDAWIVPVDPRPARPFGWLVRITYVRTLVTQLLYWPLLIRELRRADVVHVFSASYFSFLLAPLPAILVARALGKPVLLNYHSGEAPDHLRRSWLARLVLRRMVHLNVVPSPFLQKVFAGFGIRSVVVANTVDVSRYTYRNRDSLRPRLLSTRSLEALYNVECTLRAFARVQNVHPDATLTVVGGGSRRDSLQALSRELGLRNVNFVGPVAPHDMHRYYDEADIYVQTPSIDNMPLSVLEAFASGLPVVSTRVGGVPAMLVNGQAGYLAPDNDSAAIADRILEVIADPAEARRRADAARATCIRYSWVVVREDWLTAYRSLAPWRAVAVSNAAEARL